MRSVYYSEKLGHLDRLLLTLFSFFSPSTNSCCASKHRSLQDKFVLNPIEDPKVSEDLESRGEILCMKSVWGLYVCTDAREQKYFHLTPHTGCGSNTNIGFGREIIVSLENTHWNQLYCQSDNYGFCPPWLSLEHHHNQYGQEGQLEGEVLRFFSIQLYISKSVYRSWGVLLHMWGEKVV